MKLLSPQPPPFAVPPGQFRRWLKSDMRVLRWVFLALYVLLVCALAAAALADDGDVISVVVALAVMLVAQALLIFGSGTVALCHPIRRRRLVVPVFVAATMLAVLAIGLCMALWELFYLDERFSGGGGDELLSMICIGVIGLSWFGWGVLLVSRLRHKPRYTVLRKLTAYVFAGSLAELLATVPSHVIVSRRPGCLVGLGTGIGIIAGIAVMLFSFGPAIVILFLRPRWRAETADGTPYCPACGYDLRASSGRCPECGLPFEERRAEHSGLRTG